MLLFPIFTTNELYCLIPAFDLVEIFGEYHQTEMDFTCDDMAMEGIANVADCKEAGNLMIHDFTFASDIPSPDIPRGCFYGFIEQYNSYPLLYLVWNNHHLGQRCQGGGGYPFYSNCRSICSAVGRCRYSYIIIIIINVLLA